MFEILRSKCVVYTPLELDGQSPKPSERVADLLLSVAVDDTDLKAIRFSVTGDFGTHVLNLRLADDHPLSEDGTNAGTVSADFAETIVLEIEFPSEADAQHFAALGICGLPLAAAAKLESVRIQLRPSAPNDTWSADAPFFAMVACWRLTGEATGSIILQDHETEIDADVTAEITTCAGFAIINPPGKVDGVDDFLIRFDLDSFALTTNWLPLPLIDFTGLERFHMSGLGTWFARLCKVPDLFDELPLPDWNIDLPVDIDLPLGLRFGHSRLALQDVNGNYIVNALVDGLAVTWDGADILEYEDFRLSLAIADLGGSPHYVAELTLFRSHFPEDPGDLDDEGKSKGYGFALPFDALGLRADCWRLRVGLFSSGTADELGAVCIEFLLEIGNLRVSSALVGGDKSPLWAASLRLLARNFQLVANYPAAGPSVPGFFADVPADSSVAGIFDAESVRFADRYPNANARPVTFAENLAEPPSNEPANDYGIDIVDGDIRRGERLYVAWTQVNTQFLKALAHDLFSRPAAGEAPKDVTPTALGLEVAWFNGNAVQIRLDWLDSPAALARAPGTAQTWQKLDGVYVLEDPSFNNPVPLPPENAGAMSLDPIGDDPVSLSLPGIAVEVARPGARSIVLRQDSSGYSAGYLFLYDIPTKNVATDPAVQIARARLGFTLSGAEGQRDVLHNGDDEFLTVGLGHNGSGPTAIRVVGISSSGGLRFFETLSAHAPQPPILAKMASPVVTGAGCPVPSPSSVPAVSLPFDAFRTPDFANTGWQYAFRVRAIDKVLALFGDEAGNEAKLSIVRLTYVPGTGHILIATELTLDLVFGNQTFVMAGEVVFRLDPSDFSLSIENAATLTIERPILATDPPWAETVSLPELPKGRRRVWAELQDILGLKVSLFADIPTGDQPDRLAFLTLTLAEGRIAVGLARDVDMVLRYDGFGRDALSFLVGSFEIGPGGVTLDARLLASSLSVKGLRAPFALEEARLSITENRLELLSISASGTLPRLLDEAPVELTATFEQEEVGGAIEIAELVCRLGNEDEPIFSRGTRFKFEISALELRYVGEKHDRQFFFEISGSAQFTPSAGEFDNGLLENLKTVRCDFVKAPLGDEFINNLSIVAELNEPVVFDIYDLFRMEIRSIGFEPHFDEFAEPGAAIIIGGQCEFARLGDVVSAEIDFHACRIGLPRTGDALPQIHFDGLRVDISSPEGFRIAGRVDRYDRRNLKGFSGEGTIMIPGFPELSAAFSFVRLRADEEAPWKHAWFVAIEASKMSFQIPPFPIYLRQVGLGFGYRYTLPLIKTFEDPSIGSLSELIERMLDALDRHQTLARIESWTPDPEQEGRRALWTIALEAVLTLGTKQAGPYDYSAKAERKLKTLVVQVIAAIRSDFTLVAAAKVWFPVSVDDFFGDVESMRRRPLARGFMLYSAPQKRFLAHAAKNDNPYLGKPDDPWPKEVQALFRNSHFEATLLIEPGLLHAELGWPDRLMMRWKIGSLEIEIRAGVLLRVENDAIVQGIFLSARGGLDLSGGLNLGFTGVRLTARVDVYFATRLMTALYLSRPLDSKIFAELGLDLAVQFSVEAWLRINAGFCKITFRISFSFSLQIVVGLQLGWNGIGELGFKGRATVMIGVFGRDLRAGIAVGINESAVEGAQAALLPYMSSFLAPGEPPRVPDGNLLNERMGLNVRRPVADVTTEPLTPASVSPPTELPHMRMAQEDDLVLTYVTGQIDGEDATFVWIMPGPGGRIFYPAMNEADAGRTPFATLNVSDESEILTYDPEHEGSGWAASTMLTCDHTAGAGYETESGHSDTLSLRQLLAGCHVLADPADVEIWQRNPGYFPEAWAAGDMPLKAPSRVTGGDKLASISDARLTEPGHAARNPKRTLDPNNAYDRALIAAMARASRTETDPHQLLQDQAYGNQSFLLQSFYDDLVRIGNGETAAVAGATDRPTLFDLGMVFAVKGPPPAWVLKRNSPEAPTLTFTSGIMSPEPGTTHRLQPVVDFTRVNFETHPPVFNAQSTFQDEEILAVGWRLDWGGSVPAHANGADMDPESFLRAYHVRVSTGDTRRPLLERTVKPGDLVGTEDQNGRTQRLKTRYQVTLPLSDVLDSTLGGQRARRLLVTVTPEDQAGKMGHSVTFVPIFEPTLTPLPADNALCELAADSEHRPVARLSWLQPSLPNRPGVATTDHWELILRPIDMVPMGAFPQDAVEAENRGLMSATGQDLQDGDLLVDLSTLTGHSLPSQTQENTGADLYFELTLDPQSDALAGLPVLDRHGQPIRPGHPSNAALMSFRTGVTGSDPAGRAWRFFLRAIAASGVEEGATSELPASGLTPVRLTAQPAKSEEFGEALDDGDDQDHPFTARPLPHFEWPELQAPKELIVAGSAAAAGRLHVPVLLQPEQATAVDALAPNLGDMVLSYTPAPTRSRVVTVEWPALGQRYSEGRRSYAATADYAIYVTDLDRLLNADLEPTSGLAPAWTLVARAQPVDLRTAGETPDTMADVQNWISWTPSFAAVQRWQDVIGVPNRERKANRPGWYSWGESLLDWPNPLQDVRAAMSRVSTRSAMSPGEIAARQMQIDDDPPTPAGSLLSAWYDLGNQTAGVEVHPWLALLIGWIAGQRLAAVDDETAIAEFGDQVDASPGPAVTHRDPLTWLGANTAAVDPSGWAALGHLGLGITLTLRDPVTGLTRDQERIVSRVAAGREMIDRAIDAVASADETRDKLEALLQNSNGQHLDKELFDRIDALIALPVVTRAELLATYTVGDQHRLSESQVAALRNAHVDLVDLVPAAESLSTDRDVGRNRHLMLDRPIQALWARRAGPEGPRMADAALRMLHLSLRPVPRPVGLQATVKVGGDHGASADAVPMGPIRIAWHNRVRPSLRIDPFAVGAPQSLAQILNDGDEIFVLAEPYFDAEAETVRPAKLPDAWQDAGQAVTIHDHPLPLMPIDHPAPSPFGMFAPDEARWSAYWPGTTPIDEERAKSDLDRLPRIETDQARRALEYIAGAFVQSEGDDETGTSAAVILSSLTNDPATLGAYLRWSARYFDIAPLPMDIGPEVLSDLRVARNAAVSAPKTVDPIRVSADQDGTLRVTLPVEEEWATTRSYQVTSTDRYFQLRHLLTGTQPAAPAPLSLDTDRRADIHLPRIRRLEPPQILGQRLIGEVEVRQFHELAIARHAEEWLADANVILRRKISFGGITRSYGRRFKFGSWTETLLAKDWITDAEPRPIEPTSWDDGDNGTPPALDLELSRRTALSSVPRARFGATVHVTPADPFWYQSEVEVAAFAEQETAAAKVSHLPTAHPARPAPDDGPAYEIFANTRADWHAALESDAALATAVAKRHEDWDGMVAEPASRYLRPEGWHLEIRLPRFYESLPVNERDAGGVYFAETSDATYGRLPDPGLKMQLVQSEVGGDQVIARIAARAEPGENQAPYSVDMLDERYRTATEDPGHKRQGEAAWDSGLWLTHSLLRARAVESVASELVPPSVLQLPPIDILPRDALSQTGPLAQLVPLALRLHNVTGTALQMADPLHGPRWLARPHLGPGAGAAATPMLPDDLAIGLGLVLGWNRRNAAARLSWDIEERTALIAEAIEDGATDMTTVLSTTRDEFRRLLLSVEIARLAHLGPLQDEVDLKDLEFEEMAAWRVTLWLRRVVNREVVWQQVVDGSEPSDRARLLVISASLDPPSQAQADLFDRLGRRSDPNSPPSAAVIDAVTATAQVLAATGHRQDPVPQPDIYVQRGNAPRSLWAAAPARGGETEEQ